MKKVIIEITPEGWTTTIELDGKKITDEHVATSYGATGVNGCLEDNENLPDDLYEAIEGFDAYEIMKVLRN